MAWEGDGWWQLGEDPGGRAADIPHWGWWEAVPNPSPAAVSKHDQEICHHLTKQQAKWVLGGVLSCPGLHHHLRACWSLERTCEIQPNVLLELQLTFKLQSWASCSVSFSFEISKDGRCLCAPGPVVFFVFLSFTCGTNAMEEGRNLWPCLCLSFMDEETCRWFLFMGFSLFAVKISVLWFILDKSGGSFVPNRAWVCSETTTGRISRMSRFVSPKQSAAHFLSFGSWSENSHNT